ncbi:bifunctional folylpolyglutamate synthase/dihydrofolate synthase [Aquirufa antheringensis]|uniref:bifunctional folylpolyglutamate synthase/dihydrofolate synthase n=1 Tax=Aquirufa antheringensis TaxID=2516559 RepID=UPI001032FE4A|nr:folylpolyglutamate synthase/dihydrofolate synthase family protein [Aquirufa antheringensis]TBH70673.1 bifunctional folylpolyglutamate synthase/dihydrofolate synthase [Aquirufa antheringensis]
MNYSESISFLYAQLPVFHREGAKAYKPGLGNIEALCNLMGQPQDSFKSLHIAGTNGKGSSSHFMASILQEHGYKVGLYTSPHLHSFTERIKINGIQVAEEWVADFVTNHQNLIETVRPSFFEWTVIMAFTYFKEQQVDYAIIETGLGGRLDSTNIISPLACLITNISFDHQDLLGDTLEKIASEKAGIIKSLIPVTISEKQPETSEVFLAKATSVNAPLQFASDIISAVDFTFTSPTWGEMKVNSPYKGHYQQKNIRGVWAWCEQIQSIIPLEAVKIKSGIERTRLNTGLQGRWEILGESPKIIADTGHNKSGITEIMQQIKQEGFDHLTIILGMVADKDINSVLSLFPTEASYYFSQANNPRAISALELQKLAATKGLNGKVVPSVNDAIALAKLNSKPSDGILICGSTYLVGEITF